MVNRMCKCAMAINKLIPVLYISVFVGMLLPRCSSGLILLTPGSSTFPVSSTLSPPQRQSPPFFLEERSSTRNKYFFVLGMGSRGASKWERKKQWLEKRASGVDERELSPAVTEHLVQESSTTTATVPFATIVGNGRIGGALAAAGNCVVLGRNDSIDPEGDGPIFVATRNDALEDIVEKCPENRRKDLVFLQNGYLDEFLRTKGLLDNTQVLLYLSVPSKGSDPVDGVTAVNPEGLTAAVGEWAQAFANRLDFLGLKCNIVEGSEYRVAMFEKLIWISTYMLVGAANGCESVGEAGSKYRDVVEQVVNELKDAVSQKEGIQFPDGIIARLKAYTDVVADFPCAVKEFEWRNKFFWDLGDTYVPTHNRLLRECASKGILGFDLLP